MPGELIRAGKTQGLEANRVNPCGCSGDGVARQARNVGLGSRAFVFVGHLPGRQRVAGEFTKESTTSLNDVQQNEQPATGKTAVAMPVDTVTEGVRKPGGCR